MATLGYLKEQVRTRIVDDAGNLSRISSDFVTASLNRGARKYATSVPQFPIVVPSVTVSSTSPVDLMALNIYKIRNVFDENGVELSSMAHEEVVREQQLESDVPRYYSEFSKSLFVAPAPITSYDITIHGWRYPAQALVDVNDTGWFPDVEDASVDFAVWECWNALEEPSHAEVALRQFNARLDDAQNWLGVSEVRNDYSVRANTWTLRRL